MAETTTWAAMTPPDARKRYDTVGSRGMCHPHCGRDHRRGADQGRAGDARVLHKNKLTRHRLRDGWLHSGIWATSTRRTSSSFSGGCSRASGAKAWPFLRKPLMRASGKRLGG